MLLLFAELMFLETSAMTGENVEESFLKCSRVILNKIENGMHMVLCHVSMNTYELFYQAMS